MSDRMDSSEIITRLQAGRHQELTQLFMRWRQHIRDMIQVRIDRRLLARVDASDIVQETFIRASHALDAYLKSPRVHPIVWLRLIGKQLLAETHRRHFRDKRNPARELSVDHDNSDMLLRTITDSVYPVETRLEYEDLLRQVRDVLDTLPEHDREILEMRHIDGMTLHDAAMALELNFEAVKKRYQRALTRFRKLAAGILSEG